MADDPGRKARADVVHVAEAISSSLRNQGLDVENVAVSGHDFSFLQRLQERRPDAVLNLCESLAADSRGEMIIPSLLETLGIPYSGSPSLSLGLALHKDKAKEILRANGVPTPDFSVVRRRSDVMSLNLPFPLIVKPVREDASAGIDFDSVVTDRRSLLAACDRVLSTFRQPALVERYIAGKEIYVPLLGNDERTALPLSEIQFGATFVGKPHIVGYRAKWELDSDECVDSPSVPCLLPAAIERRVIDVAGAAFEALDCRDYGRVDVRLSEAGDPWVIDINPNCDLHPEAGFARAAAWSGLSYAALAARLLEFTLKRSHGDSSSRRKASAQNRRTGTPDRTVHGGRDRLRVGIDRPLASAE